MRNFATTAALPPSRADSSGFGQRRAVRSALSPLRARLRALMPVHRWGAGQPTPARVVSQRLGGWYGACLEARGSVASCGASGGAVAAPSRGGGSRPAAGRMKRYESSPDSCEQCRRAAVSRRLISDASSSCPGGGGSVLAAGSRKRLRYDGGTPSLRRCASSAASAVREASQPAVEKARLGERPGSGRPDGAGKGRRLSHGSSCLSALGGQPGHLRAGGSLLLSRAAPGWKLNLKSFSSSSFSTAGGGIGGRQQRRRTQLRRPRVERRWEYVGIRKAATMVEEMRRVTMTYSMALTRGSMKVYTEPCCAWRIGSRSAS